MMKKLVLSELAPSSARNVSIQLNRAIENEKKTFWMRGGGSSSRLYQTMQSLSSPQKRILNSKNKKPRVWARPSFF